MKLGVGSLVVAGALLGAIALAPAVSESRGGNGGRGQCGQTQQQCRQQNQNCPQGGQRDGSCGNHGCQQSGGKRGSCPGPAGGNQGAGPQGGTAVPPAAD